MHAPVTAAYETHYVALVRLAAQLVDDVGSAEEAVQEVFVRLHRRGAVGGEVTHAYLRSAVINQCRSTLRHRAVARRKSWVSDARWHGVDTGPDPAAGVVERERIRSAIGRLTRRQQEVVVLRFFEDLPLQDIAATLGITVNATSAALARALTSIAEQMGAEG